MRAIWRGVSANSGFTYANQLRDLAIAVSFAFLLGDSFAPFLRRQLD
jgi:hypothetical protein